MRRHGELVFDFTMTAQAKLWFTDSEQLDVREARFFCIRRGDEADRTGEISAGDRAV